MDIGEIVRYKICISNSLFEPQPPIKFRENMWNQIQDMTDFTIREMVRDSVGEPISERRIWI